jgi:phage tail protein X
MIFLMTMTLWSLAGQTFQFTHAILAAAPGVSVVAQVANSAVAVLLFALTAYLVYESIRVASRPRPTVPPAGLAAS